MGKKYRKVFIEDINFSLKQDGSVKIKYSLLKSKCSLKTDMTQNLKKNYIKLLRLGDA